MKSTTIFTAIAGAGLLCLFQLTAPADAAVIMVDMQRSDGAPVSITQSGWEPWAVSGTAFSTISKSFTYSAAIGGSLSVTYSANDPNLFARTYGFTKGMTSTEINKLTYPNVWYDQMFNNSFNNAGDYVQLELFNLGAGTYRFSSYHYVDDATSDGIALVYVNGMSTGIEQRSINGRSGPVTAAQLETEGTFATYFTVANNGDPVTIKYLRKVGSAGSNFGLNGFTLVAIPEPTTSVLVLLGGCALMFWRSRRLA